MTAIVIILSVYVISVLIFLFFLRRQVRERDAWRAEMMERVVASIGRYPVDSIHQMKTIIVNGRTVETDLDQISYADLIALAGYSPTRVVSVTYRSKRNGDNVQEGILIPGRIVTVDDGMVFNASVTGSA